MSQILSWTIQEVLYDWAGWLILMGFLLGLIVLTGLIAVWHLGRDAGPLISQRPAVSRGQGLATADEAMRDSLSD